MGRQVRFHNYPQDVEGLEAFVRDIEPVVFLPTRMATPAITEVPTLRAGETEAWQAQLLIVRRADLPRIAVDRQDNHDRWIVAQPSPPVTVEYSPGYGRDGHPRQQPGRMWFATTYLDPVGSQIMPADPDFIQWADRLLGWVRRHWTRIDDSYYSPQAVADHATLFPPPPSWTLVLEEERDGDTRERIRAWRHAYDPDDTLADSDIRVASRRPPAPSQAGSGSTSPTRRGRMANSDKHDSRPDPLRREMTCTNGR